MSLGKVVKMPTRVSVTYNWVGIYSSMSIDPIVYIDGNGILFTGTMDIHKYVMYGVYGLVGLTVLVFTCCCCFCKCCPVYKSRTAFMMKRAQRRTWLACLLEWGAGWWMEGRGSPGKDMRVVVMVVYVCVWWGEGCRRARRADWGRRGCAMPLWIKMAPLWRWLAEALGACVGLGRRLPHVAAHYMCKS